MKRYFVTLLFLAAFLSAGSALAAYDPTYIRNWLICGPFENAKLETVLIQDEANLSPKAGDVSAGVTWKEFDSVENSIDFEEETALGQYELSVAYASVEITSPEKKRAKLYLHSDDGIKVWLNGSNILTNDVARGMSDEDILTVILRPGANRLLIKVNDLFAGWMFSARITDENNQPIQGLTLSPKAVPLVQLPIKKIVVSSVQGGDLAEFNPKFAVDRNPNTRWSSEHYDPQIIILDFGASQQVKRINLLWETAYGKSYKIEISDDKKSWKEIYSTKDGNGGKDVILFDQPKKGGYLRILCLERGTDWGYSLWEFAVYGFIPETGEAAFEEGTESIVAEVLKPLPAVEAVASTTQKPDLVKNEHFDAKYAIDGDFATRWGSEFTDPQWIYIDLGGTKKVESIVLSWETAYAKSYKVEVSNDAVNWTQIYATDSSDGARDNIILDSSQETRYIRIYCKERGRKEWGYSLWEIQAFGE